MFAKYKQLTRGQKVVVFTLEKERVPVREIARSGMQPSNNNKFTEEKNQDVWSIRVGFKSGGRRRLGQII